MVPFTSYQKTCQVRYVLCQQGYMYVLYVYALQSVHFVALGVTHHNDVLITGNLYLNHLTS
jgi:hypothetical protein